jgi:hypothetical protein
LISTAELIIILPTMTRTEPVAQDGMLLSKGAKKIETKNQKEVVMAVRPVAPPSAIPLALSAMCQRCETRTTPAQLTDERRAWRATKEETGHGDTSGVDEETDRTSLEIALVLAVKRSLASHGSHSSGGITTQVSLRLCAAMCHSQQVDV